MSREDETLAPGEVFIDIQLNYYWHTAQYFHPSKGSYNLYYHWQSAQLSHPLNVTYYRSSTSDSQLKLNSNPLLPLQSRVTIILIYGIFYQILSYLTTLESFVLSSKWNYVWRTDFGINNSYHMHTWVRWVKLTNKYPYGIRLP